MRQYASWIASCMNGSGRPPIFAIPAFPIPGHSMIPRFILAQSCAILALACCTIRCTAGERSHGSSCTASVANSGTRGAALARLWLNTSTANRSTATPSPQLCSKLMAAFASLVTISEKDLSHQRFRPPLCSICLAKGTGFVISPPSSPRHTAKRALSTVISDSRLTMLPSICSRASAHRSRCSLVRTGTGCWGRGSWALSSACRRPAICATPRGWPSASSTVTLYTLSLSNTTTWLPDCLRNSSWWDLGTRVELKSEGN
mmetsp:Transcript_35090/g.62722  ORF Transcript_35090/g.62722 Transcript_35090/m.62722 type:complete len:260 (-) Transcript_35090:522-1301(-)